ncbi:hypothetical protein BH23BAC3_BH23BAC3_20180 [soil metagenome]
MKSIIQTITTLLIIVITFTSAEFVNANSITADTLKVTTPVDKEAEFEKIERSILYGLNSDVNGILESTLFNTVAYKTLNPEFNSAIIIDEITRVAVDNGNHVVRYKAMLTLSYLKDHDSFDVTEQIEPLIKANDANGAFQVLVDSIQEQQIVQTRNQ